jgi:hypothetical protein
MYKRRLGRDQLDHERQGVRQCHRLGVAVEVLGSKTTRRVVLCAFDLLELDGKDLRREPIERRKATLARVLRVKLTRRDHSRTAFTDYLNRAPKRGAITTLHVDGEQVKLRIDVVREQPPHTRAAASLGVFDVLATEID